MTSRDNHSPNHPHRASADELGALVRAVADGEATPEQLKTLASARARLSPGDAAALDATIQAERDLRAAADRCMREACPPCPADLRERVLAEATRADTGPSSAPTPVSDRDDREPFLFTLVRRNWAFAAAALIALVAVAGMLVLPVVAPSSGVWPPEAAQRQTLVAFLGQEHGNCAPMERYAELKLPIRERVRAEAFISQWSPDAERVMESAGAGYSFLGVGPCGVPGGGASMHMVFAPTDASRAPISVFLQDASSREPDALPRTMAQLGETADGQVVRAFRHGDCLVYVVAPTEDDAERIAANLGE